MKLLKELKRQLLSSNCFCPSLELQIHNRLKSLGCYKTLFQKLRKQWSVRKETAAKAPVRISPLNSHRMRVLCDFLRSSTYYSLYTIMGMCSSFMNMLSTPNIQTNSTNQNLKPILSFQRQTQILLVNNWKMGSYEGKFGVPDPPLEVSRLQKMCSPGWVSPSC